MEVTVAWSQVALWAVAVVLLIGSAFFARLALAEPRCRDCATRLEVVSEEAHVSWWHTSVSCTYMCPACGRKSEGVRTPFVYE